MTGPISGGHEHALDAGRGCKNLERADHVEGAEPGIENVGDQHVSSVWPPSGTHKDRLLTMSATAPRRTVTHGLAMTGGEPSVDEPAIGRPSSAAWSS